MSDAVDEILDVDYTPPTPPINNYDTTDPNVKFLGMFGWMTYNASLNGDRQSSFKRWWIGQMVNQDRTIREKMVLFWQNHFSTEMNVYNWANMAFFHNKIFRDHCLKNFKDMVHEISVDPAMVDLSQRLQEY